MQTEAGPCLAFLPAMTSLSADTVLRGLNNKGDQGRINDLTKEHQGVWQQLANLGASGPAFLEYGKAVAQLSNMNKLAAAEGSAAGELLGDGERADLLEQLNHTGNAGVEAFRELADQDTLCGCPTTGTGAAQDGTATAQATTPGATPQTNDGECTKEQAQADAQATTGTATSDGQKVEAKTADKKEATATDKKQATATTGGASTEECNPNHNPEGVYKQGATLADVANGKVLSQGEKGQGVTDAQTMLKQIKGQDGKAKYDLGNSGEKCDGIDGYLGPKTAAALEQFKKDYGLKSDGKGTLDAATLAKLKEVSGGLPAGSTNAGETATAGSKRTAKSGKGEVASTGDQTAATTSSAEGNGSATRSDAEKAALGGAAGAVVAGNRISTPQVTSGTPKFIKSSSKSVVVAGNGATGNTIHVPSTGQVVAGKLLKGAGLAGAAYGAVQDAKGLGEAAAKDTIRGDGKHTELIKEGSRDVGHWAGAALGAKGAAAVVTPFALATGPAAPFIIGAAGIGGGIAGYFAGDWAGSKAGDALSR